MVENDSSAAHVLFREDSVPKRCRTRWAESTLSKNLASLSSNTMGLEGGTQLAGRLGFFNTTSFPLIQQSRKPPTPPEVVRHMVEGSGHHSGWYPVWPGQPILPTPSRNLHIIFINVGDSFAYFSRRNFGVDFDIICIKVVGRK